ncbi:MAG: hypothetical protein ACR2N3_07515 [Pyrinomonadaceae bacterium]
MMKKFLILSLLALALTACSQTNQNVSTPNTNAVVQTSNETAVVSSHSTENSATPTVTDSNSAKSSASSVGSPMAKAIDVSQMTATIENAGKTFDAKPNDAKAENDLAEAYFTRAFALTEAAQYRSALGDFRKGLKLNPNNADAKAMHDQIISIFQSIGREPPKEGEEPPPLPFEKQQNTSSDNSRIVFEKGATSTIAQGSLKNYDDSKTFTIETRAGQTLRTEQIKSEKSLEYITVSITDPSGNSVGDSDASCNNRKEIAPTVAGDYKIKVFECRKADAWRGDFQLKIWVR